MANNNRNNTNSKDNANTNNSSSSNNRNANKSIVKKNNVAKSNVNRNNVNKSNSNKNKGSSGKKNNDENTIRKNIFDEDSIENTGINDIEIFADGLENENEIQEIQEIPEIQEINISRNAEKRAKDVVGNCRRVLRDKHKNEQPETNMKTDFKNNIVLWCVLGVLGIILIIALIVTNMGDDESKEKETAKPEAATTTIETTTTQEDKKLVAEASDSPITTLISNYLQAERIDVSMDEVTKYVDNSEKISLDKYEVLKKYIEEYQNINCYKLNSIDENTFIVIVTYGCKFYNIETAAPGCETFLVVNKDNQYFIHNLTVQESIDTYISSDVDVSLINQINKEINDSLKAAIESDRGLAEVIAVLSGSEGETTETTTVSGNDIQ